MADIYDWMRDTDINKIRWKNEVGYGGAYLQEEKNVIPDSTKILRSRHTI